jgi:hypothetical protein
VWGTWVRQSTVSNLNKKIYAKSEAWGNRQSVPNADLQDVFTPAGGHFPPWASQPEL